MPDDNQDEDQKYIAALYLCRKYNGDCWSNIDITPRNQQEAIGVLNMLADATRDTLDKLNKLARINYDCKTVKT